MNVRAHRCLKFIFNQKYFFDKMDLRLFYFHVTMYSVKVNKQLEVNNNHTPMQLFIIM